MTTELLPPLVAIGNATVEIYGPSPDAARWDAALWDVSNWATLGWHDVTPQSMVVKLSWGADDPEGVLTVPAAGSWSIETYDPDRVLDPANGGSVYAASLRPGRPMRISVIEPGKAREPIRVGLIDEITYDIKEKRGSIRGTDIVPLMVQAKLGAGQNDDPALPDTLRARARYLVNKVGLGLLVPVDPEPPPIIELLRNGSFEEGYTGWTPTNGGDWYPEEGAVPEGGGLYRANLYVPAGPADYPSIYSDPIQVSPNQVYTLSGWTASWGTARMRSMRLEWHYPDHSWGGIVGEIVISEPPDGVFTFHSQGWPSPPDAGWMVVRLFIYEQAIPATDHFAFWDLMSVTTPNPETRVDPPVGPLPNDRDASVWSLIGTSAFDALYAMWVDRFGTLRFRSFGNPQDEGFTVGGEVGIPISTLKTRASIAGVYTSVRAFDDDAPTVPVTATDPASSDLYGIITLTRDKPVPDARVWVDSVLADRAGSGLQYETGTLYPRTFAELMSIVGLEMVDIVHMIADDIVPPLDVPARLLGVKLTADTDTGWTAEIVSYIPAKEWEEAETPPPIEPPIEPPPNTQVVTRYYDANKDSRAARDSGGTAMGSGTEGELPVGAWSGWRNRSFIGFASIPFGDVVSIDKAELELDTSSQVNIGFGSSPKITVKRVTSGWNEGSSSSPSTGNATKYPGPNVTSTDAKTVAVTKSENASVVIDITAMARAWLAGSAQYGVGLFSAGEDSTTYTTEFWSRENSTAGKRPRLKLTLTVRV